MIPAPVLAVGCGGALMRYFDRATWRAPVTFAVAIGTIAFFVFSLQSSYLVLSDALVGPNDHVRELRSLRSLLHGRPTLALFYDDFYQWELLGVLTGSPTMPSNLPAPFQAAKPWSFGQPLDFDSVSASTLDSFDYVITTRTAAQSEPPPNFRLVGASRSYDVWRRVGPTAPRLVLPESGAPGAILDSPNRCRPPNLATKGDCPGARCTALLHSGSVGARRVGAAGGHAACRCLESVAAVPQFAVGDGPRRRIGRKAPTQSRPHREHLAGRKAGQYRSSDHPVAHDGGSRGHIVDRAVLRAPEPHRRA